MDTEICTFEIQVPNSAFEPIKITLEFFYVQFPTKTLLEARVYLPSTNMDGLDIHPLLVSPSNSLFGQSLNQYWGVSDRRGHQVKTIILIESEKYPNKRDVDKTVRKMVRETRELLEKVVKTNYKAQSNLANVVNKIRR